VRKDFVHIGGTKNETRDRDVPLVRRWQRELVDYALELGMGKDGLLFRPNTSFTHARLRRGCARSENRAAEGGSMLTRRELFGGALLLLPLVRAARAESCGAADPNELGPFYRAGAPQRAVLCDTVEPGDPYRLRGRVLGEGCAPVADALVEAWHADHHGDYDMSDPGKPRDPSIYHLRGVLRSGADGAYELRTIVPGHYGRRARHIHFLFHANGYEPFVTQSYFPDDPRVATDPIARRRNVVRNGVFTVQLRRPRPNSPEAIARFSGYEGDYVVESERPMRERTRAVVTRAGDALFVQLDGWPKMELRFSAPDRFRVIEFDAQGHAERGPDGKVVALAARAYGDSHDERLVRAP